MADKENHDSQEFDTVKISNLDLKIENNWSPYIEKELLVEIKSPIKEKRNPEKSELKSFCLLLGVLTLLSIGLCIQADSIAQSLKEIVLCSLQQAIPVNIRSKIYR